MCPGDTPGASPEEPPVHIVIIDDEAAVAETLADSVRDQGHTVAIGHSGAEGLALLAEKTPDAVFLDLVMPGLRGVELLKEIRRGHPELPIVVVTGRAGPQDLDEVRRLGVTDIVEKPWALKYVDEALRRLRVQ
jgi:CheY-like chemotaxis protein